MKAELQKFIDNSEINKKSIIDRLKKSLSKKEMENIEEEIQLKQLKITKSKEPNFIITMDGSKRILSPFLKERFYFCDKLVDGFETFHGIDDIQKILKSEKFISWYKTMAEDWENSAPQIFSRFDVSLLSTVNEDDGDYCLIVWQDEKIEPEIWKYSGQHEQVFNNLYDFFVWMNTLDK
ncbi:hypothetical protein [Psychrobacter sp. I-STPA10]|uniref:hypothetical protein n=1 Tax=Psychrobacter sp. I-STPA10 TaxID=2585769 RepID=UPI001E44E1B0|nr:hypothetical protein [Psychrobacter sp. I-STPA10]